MGAGGVSAERDRQMITPTLTQHLERVAAGRRSPLRCRIPADLETPVSAFLKLKPRGAVFLLESVERGIQVGRYSFIGVAPYARLWLQREAITLERNGERVSRPVDPGDPFAAVRAELEDPTIGPPGDPQSLTPHPGPFAAAVGYIAYDMARYFDRVPLPSDDGFDLPDYHFLFPGTLVAFDHVKTEIEILTLPPAGDPRSAYEAARAQVHSLLEALRAPLTPPGAPLAGSPGTAPVFQMTSAAFQEKVRRAKEHILAGNAFQIVLSQRLRGETAAPPFQIYRSLRILNPSPYMFFLDFGGWQLIGSSPEALVTLNGRNATVSPIAGTRPRGATLAADEALAAELLADEKERAEHVMLVDLGRNDLGRVCQPGTVAPETLIQVERYSHVMHLVSRVRGTLRPDRDMFDLLRATFPAGTVTGAPKIRAMEILRDLEEVRRGPYAGAVGYFGRAGEMDLCITIRTILMRGREYLAQAGAGIVADSDPAREYQETLNKIGALTQAVSIAEGGLD
jgi:anthranilate synthase component 1